MTYTIVDVRNSQQATATIQVTIVPVAVEDPPPVPDRRPPPPPVVQQDPSEDMITDIEPDEPAAGEQEQDDDLDSPPPAARTDGDLPYTGGQFLWHVVTGSALVAIGGWQALKPRRREE